MPKAKKNVTDAEPVAVETGFAFLKDNMGLKETTLWKICDEQTMVMNLPTGCIIMFDGHGMQFVPNLRWENGRFQRAN